jgi:uncharacterized protein (TIGR02147 family)
MKTSVFDYKEYKTYVIATLDQRTAVEKGQRTRLSKYIGCQSAYLSQVLNGGADFSAEQAIAVSQFLNHTQAESKYFLNLVLIARAGTKDLREYYQTEIKKILDDRHSIKDRISAHRVLSETDQARYYSAWYFAAIHVIVSLPQFKSGQAIAETLNLSPKIVSEALEFLVQIGLLKKVGANYHQGEVSLQSLEQTKSQNLHYSSVITCSKEDYVKVRELMISAVEKIRAVIKPSKDEIMATYSMDLISLSEKDENEKF